MFTAIVVGALSATALVPQTDTIIEANGASRLDLEAFRGEVVVRVWDRDAVQIQAEHSSSVPLRIERSGTTLSVEPNADRGFGISGSVDYRITVPRSFDLSFDGVALSVDVRGTEGRIDVGTVHGAIHVEGGRESIDLESVNGGIHVEGAQGDLEVKGVAGGVTIRSCSGDVYVESVGGPVTMEGIDSESVEVGTVGGTLRFEGRIRDGGKYTFGSHGGEIWLSLPGNINARVNALTLAGEMEVSYPGAPSEPTRGQGIPGLPQKELNFQLGNGSARIEVETFGGTVHISRAGG